MRNCICGRDLEGNYESSIRAKTLQEFWNELRNEAQVQYDCRVELLGPIETDEDSACRKTLGDGWSAWLLAKRIVDNRRAAITGTEAEG